MSASMATPPTPAESRVERTANPTPPVAVHPLPPPVVVLDAPPRRRAYIAIVLLLVGGAALTLARALPRLLGSPPPHVVTASGRIEGREVTLAPKDIQGRVEAPAGRRRRYGEGGRASGGTRGRAAGGALAEPGRAAIANVDAQIRQASLDVRLHREEQRRL